MKIDVDYFEYKATIAENMHLITENHKLKEEIEVLKYIIKDVYSSIHHELHEHILQHDEDSWNPEYYTDGKLDYRKLLIALLSDYENRLIKEEDKKREFGEVNNL